VLQNLGHNQHRREQNHSQLLEAVARPNSNDILTSRNEWVKRAVLQPRRLGHAQTQLVAAGKLDLQQQNADP